VKLHDLKPAPGSRTTRTRVGRGIAAGKGKTAGRGTKGQKSRAGSAIPAWFEGGQTPAHIRLPKLHGFRNRGRIEYQVVNVGRISEYAQAGRLGADAGSAPVTVNSEVLRACGLISSERRPVKVLGHGDVSVKLFVAADAFTRSARAKVEKAGGFVQALAPAISGEDEPEHASHVEAAAPEATEAVAVAVVAEVRPDARAAGRRRAAKAGAPEAVITEPATPEAIATPEVGVAEPEPPAAPVAPKRAPRARKTVASGAPSGTDAAAPTDAPPSEPRRRSRKTADTADA
jgi:large subunit ribosomal protein L15